MAEWWEAAPIAKKKEWWEDAPLHSGAEEMRARGLRSPDPAEANAAADPRTGLQKVADYGTQIVQGGAQGIAGLAGIPGSIVNMEANALGSDFRLPTGVQGMREGAEALVGNTPPINEMERRARTASEYVAPAAVTGGMFGGPAGLMASTGSGLASGVAAGEVRERGGGPGVEMIASILAGGAPIGVANMVSKAGQRAATIKAVPDIEDLKASAGALYDTGTATGGTAARGYTQRLADGIKNIAKTEGMVLPSGETMTTSYPKVAAAMRMIDEYAGAKMNPEQMRQVRRVIQDAAQSADGGEARIGTKMLKQFDQFVEPLVPEFKQADKLYSRAMRGSEVKEAIDIAEQGRRTPGVNAISNEFQNLTRKGIRGDLTFPPELEDAVRRAANGGMGRQIAEVIGKAAPTSVVGGGAGFGIPAATVTALTGGNAVLGTAAGTAASGAGMMARMLANRLAQGDARKALATALNGGALDDPKTPEAIKAAIAALLASTAAGQQSR